METLTSEMTAIAKAAGTVRGTLQILHLRVAHECTARGDIRYYLNGLCVELHPAAVIVIATDGHRLLAARDATEPPHFADCTGPLRFYIENDALVQIISTFGKSKLPRVAFAFDLATGMVEFTGGAGLRISISGGADTANAYPSWRRVVPRQPSGVQAQFDPRYLCSASKLAQLLSGRSKIAPPMRIDHNGDSGALITFGEHHQIALVLMPYRMSEPGSAAWVDEDRGSPSWR